MDLKGKLPYPITEHPHWRVNIRPNEYQDKFIPTLSKCIEIIQKTKLSLRGWDYPHLSNYQNERGQGNNWVASWSTFMGHVEYWRFYQSGQFLHLFSVREWAIVEWKEKLQTTMKSHLYHRDDIDWDKIPGFIATLNLIYTVTEIFEFATRLCEVELYKGAVNINISIKNIQGFVLSAGIERSWYEYYATHESNIGNIWVIDSDKLLADSANFALNACIWFFERFGWLNPSPDIIRQDIENFLKGRI